MKKASKARKLVLTVEMVRDLTKELVADRLAQVAGGAPTISLPPTVVCSQGGTHND
jgi:hypothetical protein